MRIAKPLLLLTTPLGVLGGLREAYRFNPGLAFLMFALLSIIAAAVGTLVFAIRKERAAENAQIGTGTATSRQRSLSDLGKV